MVAITPTQPAQPWLTPLLWFPKCHTCAPTGVEAGCDHSDPATLAWPL